MTGPAAAWFATRARPAVLAAVLVPLHVGGQLLLLGRVAPALLAVPLLAVAAFEMADRAASRLARRGASAAATVAADADG